MLSNPNFSTVVTDLSDAVVKELGIDGLKFVIAVGNDGNLKLSKPAQ